MADARTIFVYALEFYEQGQAKQHGTPPGRWFPFYPKPGSQGMESCITLPVFSNTQAVHFENSLCEKSTAIVIAD